MWSDSSRVIISETCTKMFNPETNLTRSSLSWKCWLFRAVCLALKLYWNGQILHHVISHIWDDIQCFSSHFPQTFFWLNDNKIENYSIFSDHFDLFKVICLALILFWNVQKVAASHFRYLWLTFNVSAVILHKYSSDYMTTKCENYLQCQNEVNCHWKMFI